MASVRAQPWAALEADNLTSLAELTETNLLKAIEERYRAGLIYTAVGDILVAVNPFQELLMYDGAWSGAYAATDVSGLAPHIYRVASAAYNSMVQGKKNQVCVISGESGAGKTESAKFIMKQVSHSSIERSLKRKEGVAIIMWELNQLCFMELIVFKNYSAVIVPSLGANKIDEQVELRATKCIQMSMMSLKFSFWSVHVCTGDEHVQLSGTRTETAAENHTGIKKTCHRMFSHKSKHSIRDPKVFVV